ncbi:tyrosine-type recombinase/integrase [Amycolatopsis sp. NPDC059021]|uniref:tyrosine-type recombinase/integrase n=1 Tax=Amycolatopsis sp. NPDC059021 TaxID=3346704 RepID=UPI00366E2565
MAAKTRKPRRGLGYSIEEIHRKSGTKYRAYVWNAVAKKKEWARNADGGTIFDFYEQAEAAAKLVLERVDDTYTEAGIPVQRQKRRFTFKEYGDAWWPDQGGTENTRQQRKWCLNALNHKFGHRWIDEITEAEFRAWDAAEEKRGIATSTRQQRFWVLRAMMKQAHKDGARADNPAADLWVKAFRKKPIRYFGEQVLYEVVAWLPMWFWPAAILSYYCGLRAAEISGLRWERLDLDGIDPHVLVSDVLDPGRVLRTFPKGKKAKKVALPPVVVAALKVLRAWRRANGFEERPEDFVFRNTRNKPLTTDYPNRLLKKAWLASGLPGTRPVWHHLRHNVGNNLAEADAPAHVIKAVLRHESLSTSQEYIDEVDTRRQRAWMARSQEIAQRQSAEVIELRREPIEAGVGSMAS